MDVLSPYTARGVVTLHPNFTSSEAFVDDPTSRSLMLINAFPAQLQMVRECVTTYGHRTVWMAFFDVDEFIMTPGHTPLNRCVIHMLYIRCTHAVHMRRG